MSPDEQLTAYDRHTTYSVERVKSVESILYFDISIHLSLDV